MSANPQNLPEITDQLVELLGADHVLLSDADREFYAMDVYTAREVPMAVAQPGSLADLQGIARIASAAGVAMVPRAPRARF
jgi:FAD/FMN-containing dehydrogenase